MYTNKDMKRVILVRHGQTEHNVVRIFQSDDQPLSDIGRGQIERFAQSIEDAKIEVILHSPLSRAAESASIIGHRIDVNPEPLGVLVEFRNPPEIRGKSYDDEAADKVYREWVSKLDDKFGLGVDAVENYIDLYSRAGRVLDVLCGRNEQDILVVSHSELIRAVVARVVLDGDIPNSGVRGVIKRLKIENAHSVELLYDDDKNTWRLVF